MTAEEALNTIKTLAVMLGWGNVPPPHIFEQEIRALKQRINTLIDEHAAEFERGAEMSRTIDRHEEYIERLQQELSAERAKVQDLERQLAVRWPTGSITEVR